jgi:hypothetical protein
VGDHQHTDECREVFAQLSEYLDLELNPDACLKIQEHLKDCGPCVEFVESLRKTIELCKQYRPNETPPSLTSASRQALLSAYRKAIRDIRPPAEPE